MAFGDGRASAPCSSTSTCRRSATGPNAPPPPKNKIHLLWLLPGAAQHPQVRQLIAADVDEANRRLSAEPMMAASQVRRFLILHKELDADDGELTRTQKVRRSFIAERYGELIEALL